jgi:uncharacterized protein YecE (DUF72 family)
VNTSYYRIPSATLPREWLRAVEASPAFRFTAKVWRGFTHGPQKPTAEDLAAQRAFLAALSEGGRFLAALAQFPPAFRASARTEAYVHRLAEHFEGFPLAVEFRDASWDRDDVREGLGARGVAWVSADLLPGPRAVAPRALRTSPLAYVRFHGRNPSWYEPGVERDRRYDHLYSPEELTPWLEPIRRLIEADERVVVAFNNHPRGQSLANALELRAHLSGSPVLAPDGLLAAYPRLSSIARSDGLFA